MDEERSSMLPMMAAGKTKKLGLSGLKYKLFVHTIFPATKYVFTTVGLSSILFAINIDNAEFNVSKQVVNVL